jgi:predicted DNA-binding transcriptional regulator AlpA
MAQILRTIEIARRRGVSKSTVYADIRAGLWPRLVPLGPRLRGQPEHEVDTMIEAIVAGKPADEIRLLVQRLTAARKNVGQPAPQA